MTSFGKSGHIFMLCLSLLQVLTLPMSLYSYICMLISLSMDPNIPCMDVFRKQDVIISTVLYRYTYTNKIISAFHYFTTATYKHFHYT